MANRITEVQIFRYMVVLLVFLLLAFNRDLGMIYMLMILGDYLWWRTDKRVSLPTERVNKRPQSLYYAVIGYVLFFVSNIIIQSVFSGGGSIQSVLTQISSTTPVLRSSNLLTLIGWGIVIPVIESRFFFGRLFEGAMEIFGGNLSSLKFTQRTAMITVIISALFALFHITSKNLENVPLIATFVFGAISCWIVVKEKQLMGAILFHIFTNMTAVMFTFRPEVFASLGLI